MACAICLTKTKALISCAVFAQLIYAFVFAYAKSRFSHDAAHLIYHDMVCPFSLYPARPPTEYFICYNNMLEKGLLFSIC